MFDSKWWIIILFIPIFIRRLLCRSEPLSWILSKSSKQLGIEDFVVACFQFSLDPFKTVNLLSEQKQQEQSYNGHDNNAFDCSAVLIISNMFMKQENNDCYWSYLILNICINLVISDFLPFLGTFCIEKIRHSFAQSSMNRQIWLMWKWIEGRDIHWLLIVELIHILCKKTISIITIHVFVYYGNRKNIH